MIREDIPEHVGHEITVDFFAALAGVARYVPGNLYCATCKEPIPYRGEPHGSILEAEAK